VSDGGTPGPRGLRLVHIAPLVPLLIISAVASRHILDNSFLWHIRAGSHQIDIGRVLTEDPFSFRTVGQAWRTQSWLAELLYAWLESLFGSLAWVNWMTFVTAGLVMLFAGIAVYRNVKSPVVTGFVLVVTAWLMGPFVQPRPVIFSFLLLAMLVVVLQHRETLAWAVIPIIWLWAGIHGSWVLGGALVFLEWIRTKDRKLLFAGAAAGLATLATAHGFGTWEIVLDFFRSRDALALMEEWKAPEFGDVVQAPYFLVMVGLIVAGIRGKVSIRDLIVIVPFLFFGLTSRRAVVPAAIILIPWAALCLPELKPSNLRFGKPLVVAGMTALAVLAISPMFIAPLGVLDSERFPSRAIVEAMGSDRAFHDDASGGYLIAAEWPERLVYVDDRAELFGVDGLKPFHDIRAGKYAEEFEKWGIDVALVRPDWDLYDRLTEDGWTIRLEDEYFAVFERP